MSPIQDVMTVWTIRVAALLYVTSLFARLRGWEARARALWTAGLLSYLAHVAAAFQFVHDWSHARAALETARQTEELFGIASGAGLWLNYLFTAVWTADALWWWMDARGYGQRPRWITLSVHAFLAFMFFNGAVVFAEGFSRWVGLAAIPPLVFLWLRSRRGRGI